jgi:hypothetical protein
MFSFGDDFLVNLEIWGCKVIMEKLNTYRDLLKQYYYLIIIIVCEGK